MENLCGFSETKDAPKQLTEQQEDTTPKNEEEAPVAAGVSPFIAYDDGYEYPTLYEECDEMLQACIFMFPMADLRRLAREDKTRTDSILKLPLTVSQVVDIVEENKNLLVNEKFGQEFYLDLLKAAEERHMFTTSRDGGTEIHTEALKESQLVAFDDEFEQEELVYGIVVNPIRKRITVCFRGSITKQDWATDREIFMKEVPNPLHEHASQTDTVKIHNGFHDYLFSPTERGAKGLNGEPLSEYEEILQEHVLPVIQLYPGYKLYITGHSLGGALATLFAFEAAALPDSVIPKPVTCVSIASPYVGDDSFRQAHQLLERLGKLRHVRVMNHKDIITTIPKMSFKFNLFDWDAHVGSLFKHVGMGVRLFHDEVEIFYPKVRTGTFTSYYDEFGRAWSQSLFSNFVTWDPIEAYKTYHLMREYNRRLMLHKERLEGIKLNDLYSNEELVGRLLAEF